MNLEGKRYLLFFLSVLLCTPLLNKLPIQLQCSVMSVQKGFSLGVREVLGLDSYTWEGFLGVKFVNNVTGV